MNDNNNNNNTREPVSSEVPSHSMAIGVGYHTHTAYETHETHATHETHPSQIVVPLDGSRLAEKALPHAIALARATSRAITLLRVLPPVTLTDPLGGALPPSPALWEVWETEPQVARDYLQAMADKLRETEPIVQTRVLEGDPAGEIVSYAKRHPDVSLVVMSSHGRSGLGRWVMGSVAEKVLKASPVPLLVVRPETDEGEEAALTIPQYKTILVPLDGSEMSEVALEEAQTLAEKMGATIVLLSVTSTPFDLVLTKRKGAEEWSPAPWNEEVQHLTSKLDAVSKRLQAQNLAVEVRMTYGDPASEILKLSKEVGADVIVMATHGRGGLAHLFIGSVATRIVRAAHVPVLLVRVKAEADHGEHRERSSGAHEPTAAGMPL